MEEKKLELATFGGGCFWCTEAVFQEVKGVEKIVSGYTGGTAPGKPTYREVCSGLTGHAEAIQITFDPTIISFEDLVVIFMTTHDPTTLNRQGGDVGTQYRSVIYYHNEVQKKNRRNRDKRYPIVLRQSNCDRNQHNWYILRSRRLPSKLLCQ